MSPHNSKIDIFIARAIVYEGDDCLIWPFALNSSRYAHSGGFGGVISRYVCKKVYGAPPTPKHQAAHSIKCVSKACVNNKHLRWATQEENLADDCRGEDCSWTKLTEEQVIEIRKLKGTMSLGELAKIYGFSNGCIRGVIYHSNWQWLVNNNFVYSGPQLF
jgi:hypothetical protein